ncbi:MAG TPA: hypothetical protein PKD54_04555 [Pirellulaceae bacterium]|nr:hypothetical protein [Pirellulaceae bacterium]
MNRFIRQHRTWTAWLLAVGLGLGVWIPGVSSVCRGCMLTWVQPSPPLPAEEELPHSSIEYRAVASMRSGAPSSFRRCLLRTGFRLADAAVQTKPLMIFDAVSVKRGPYGGGSALRPLRC